MPSTWFRYCTAAGPTTASILRTPDAMPASDTILNAPICARRTSHHRPKLLHTVTAARLTIASCWPGNQLKGQFADVASACHAPESMEETIMPAGHEHAEKEGAPAAYLGCSLNMRASTELHGCTWHLHHTHRRIVVLLSKHRHRPCTSNTVFPQLQLPVPN